MCKIRKGGDVKVFQYFGSIAKPQIIDKFYFSSMVIQCKKKFSKSFKNDFSTSKT